MKDIWTLVMIMAGLIALYLVLTMGSGQAAGTVLGGVTSFMTNTTAALQGRGTSSATSGS